MIGIGSPAFCNVPFKQMLEEISSQFRLWEVLAEGEDRLELAEASIRYGISSMDMRFQVHAPLSDVNIGSVHEPMRKAAISEIEDTIARCRLLDIRTVTVHPGFVQGIAFLDRSKAVSKTKESLAALSRFSMEHSVDLAIENLPANINGTCTQARELLEVIDGTELGICFDMGHANTAGQVDDMLRLVDRFKNVHLHNNEGEWDQHNRIDDGSADVQKVVSALKSRYHGHIIIESTDLESGAESKAILEKLLG